MGRRGCGGGGKGRLYTYIATLSPEWPALQWAAMRAILMFHNCEGRSHKTVSTDHNFWSERRVKMDLSWGLSAYQPNASLLGQTSTHTHTQNNNNNKKTTRTQQQQKTVFFWTCCVFGSFQCWPGCVHRNYVITTGDVNFLIYFLYIVCLQTSAALHLSPLSRKIWKHICLKNASLLVCETPFDDELMLNVLRCHLTY